MVFEIIINKLVDILLFPPGINLILLLIGFLTFKKFKKFAILTFTVSIGSLYLLSLPAISNILNESLYTHSALTPGEVKDLSKKKRKNLAIVVVSGGRISLAPEYGDIDTVNSLTLQRLQYAAWLHRQTNLPILLSGGRIYGEATAESVLMNQTMLSSFNIAPRWIEFESKNTAEKALFSEKILLKNGMTEILLVTHANHMQRAYREFAKSSLKIIPAPTTFTHNLSSWHNYFPSAKGLYDSQIALHEKVGRLWYAYRYSD